MVRVAKVEGPSEEELFHQKVAGFVLLKQQIAELTKEANAARDEISAVIDERGEPDSSGSLWLQLDGEVEGVKALKRERRVTRGVYDAAVESILGDAGLYSRCHDLVPVLNQDEVMACYTEGLLTDEDLEEMFPAKVSWALVTEKKK